MESEFNLSLMGLDNLEYLQTKNTIKINLTRPPSDKTISQHTNHQTDVSGHYGYYFREGVALFEFIEGHEIRVSPMTNTFDEDFFRVLLNYPMACLLYQQGYFLLHASAVEFREKVYLFPGPSLCGKSTLAAYLVKHGGKLITEDTAAIAITDQGAFISPSYPLIKLSGPANKYIGLGKSSGINFPRDNNARKGHLLSSTSFVCKPKKIDFCIFPEWGSSGGVLEKLSFSLAIGNLMLSSQSSVSLDRSKEKRLLSANARFLKNVSAYAYKREQSFLSLESLIKDLEALQGQTV